MKKTLKEEQEKIFRMDLTNRVWEAATACMIKHQYGEALIPEDSLELLKQCDQVALNLIERYKRESYKRTLQSLEAFIELLGENSPKRADALKFALDGGITVPANLVFELRNNALKNHNAESNYKDKPDLLYKEMLRTVFEFYAENY